MAGKSARQGEGITALGRVVQVRENLLAMIAWKTRA
jgi:hypothetical protein